MSGVTYRSDAAGAAAVAASLAPVRVTGGVHARFTSDGARTAIASVAERGGYRLSRPTTFAPHVEAMQLNTGGGIAGGDRVETRYELGRGADVVHTAASGERIYRSAGPPARLTVQLVLEPASRLDWLPQQTLVYAGAHLERRIEVDMAGDSRLLLVEMLTFGRPESAEGTEPVSIDDQWRVRRGNRLVYAEALRFSGVLGDMLARPAIGGGARASAIVLLVASDAPDHVDALRQVLQDDSCESGVSAWDGLLVLRLLAHRPGALVATVARLVPILSGRTLPRVWGA